ncbi:MAG: hypothetical protein E6J75_07910 [Deltaproteobacteria bacterium]|nr:MAG: hypothetical protein E6J75_07910 [Deltaproteobacteria bacterium]
MPRGELEGEREQALALLAREPFLEVTDARPSRRLQTEELDLDEAGRRRPGHHRIDQLEVLTGDDHVDAHARARPDQDCGRAHAGRRLVRAEDADGRERVDRDVDLSEERRGAGGERLGDEGAVRGEVRRDPARPRRPGDVEQIRAGERLAAADRHVEDARAGERVEAG